MSYEITYSPGVQIEVAHVGDSGYRTAVQYAAGDPRYAALAADLDRMGAQTAQVELEQKAEALRAEVETLTAEAATLKAHGPKAVV